MKRLKISEYQHKKQIKVIIAFRLHPCKLSPQRQIKKRRTTTVTQLQRRKEAPPRGAVSAVIQVCVMFASTLHYISTNVCKLCVNTQRHIYTHLSIFMYICMYVFHLLSQFIIVLIFYMYHIYMYIHVYNTYIYSPLAALKYIYCILSMNVVKKSQRSWLSEAKCFRKLNTCM